MAVQGRSSSDRLHLSGCVKGQTLIPECESFENGEDDTIGRYRDCTKNPEHPSFYPVYDFKVENLPHGHRTLRMMNEVVRRSALTVRVKVSYTSVWRPDTFVDSEMPYPYAHRRGSKRHVRYGTGNVAEVFYYQPVRGKSCPCPPCQRSSRPKNLFWWLRVRTASHVIYDKSEAEKAVFECFFDTNDRKGVKTVYGFDTFHNITSPHRKYRNDVFDTLCVTHDRDTVEVFNRIIPADQFIRPPTFSPTYQASVVLLSHPHGCSKSVTVGKILHLTVPISQDYPRNSPIRFKKGTVYRKSSDSIEESRKGENETQRGACPNSSKYDDSTQTDIKSNTDSETNDRQRPEDSKSTGGGENVVDPPPKNFGLDSQVTDFKGFSQFFDMKERMDAIKSIDTTKDNTINVQDNQDTICSDPFTIESKTEYIREFYSKYIRENCLKILVLSSLLYQKSTSVSDNFEVKVSKAYDEVFNKFLGKERHSTPPENNPSEVECANFRLRLWTDLLIDSEEEFGKWKSNATEDLVMTTAKNASPSVIVSWFNEVDKIVFDFFSKTEQGKENPVEDLLPEINDQIFLSGCKILTTHCNSHAPGGSPGVQSSSSPKHDEHFKEKSSLRKEGNKNYDNNGDDLIVQDGSTFTLPDSAEYAFRVNHISPGWIQFPAGTVMTSPDGTQEDIGTHVEFRYQSVHPEQSFVTYQTDTCPGSSGANVFCDMLGQYLGTFFPHSCSVSEGVNRSGVRDVFASMYLRLFLFSPAHGVSMRGTSSLLSRHPPDLIQTTKNLLQRIQAILKKDLDDSAASSSN